MVATLLLWASTHAQEPPSQSEKQDSSPAQAEDTPPDTNAPPVPFPKLNHFSHLWEHSLFTTREIPLPESDDGPNFTDQLSLAGVYEVDGALAAVIVDKTTSLVSEVRIGSDNESGIRIKQVETGALPSSTRIQLLKNGQLGWISFDQVDSGMPAAGMPPPGAMVRAAIPVRPTSSPPPAAASALLPAPNQIPRPLNDQAPVSDIPLPPE